MVVAGSGNVGVGPAHFLASDRRVEIVHTLAVAVDGHAIEVADLAAAESGGGVDPGEFCLEGAVGTRFAADVGGSGGSVEALGRGNPHADEARADADAAHFAHLDVVEVAEVDFLEVYVFTAELVALCARCPVEQAGGVVEFHRLVEEHAREAGLVDLGHAAVEFALVVCVD